MDRITSENNALLQRLQEASPSVDPRQWEIQEEDRQALIFRLSQNSVRGQCPALHLRTPCRSQPPGSRTSRYAVEEYSTQMEPRSTSPPDITARPMVDFAVFHPNPPPGTA